MALLAHTLEDLIDFSAARRQHIEERYLTDGVNWQAYEAVLAKLGDRAGYRVSYLDGVLEIMAPSRRHEQGKTHIGTLLEIYFVATNTTYFPMGSTTLRREAQEAGVEPDESYCLGSDKEFPDLAIEVVVTSGGLNRLAIYRRLGVPEVWFWQQERFTLYHLRADQPSGFPDTHGYAVIARSELLPALDLALLTACVRQSDPLTAARTFRAGLG